LSYLFQYFYKIDFALKKFYSSIIQITIERAAVKRAWEFANKVIATVNYADSNQHQTKKILDDHFISKLGEEACKIVLQQYAKVEGPDYAIYEAQQKSWSDDLIINNTGVAVKTQRRTNAGKYTLSWTFQCAQTRRDTILDKPDAWIVFVEYDDTCPYNCYVYPPYQVKELKFSEPKLQYLKQSKKVVYAAELPC
jgi:hypothetical protein